MKDLAEINTHVVMDAEDGFFSALALQHTKELQCSVDFAKEMVASSEGRQRIIARMQSLRDARQRLQQASDELMRNPQAQPKICPVVAQDFKPQSVMIQLHGKDLHYELCKEIMISRSAVEAISRSVPLSGSPGFANLLDRFAALPPGPELQQMERNLDAELIKVYQEAQGLLASSARALERKGRGDGAEIDRSTRYALMSDPLVVQKVIDRAGPDNKTVMETLACHADQRFYSGSDALDRTMLVGSFAVAGGASLALRGGTVVKLAVGAGKARAAGLLSINSTRVIEATALSAELSLGAFQEFSQIDKKCGRPVMATATDGQGECVSAPKMSQWSHEECVLGVALAAVGYGPLVLTAAMRAPRVAAQMVSATENVRLATAQQLLQRPLSAAQQEAVLKAHNVGAGAAGLDGSPAAIGNYTSAQLREKAEILRMAGFDVAETRTLMENGVVGFTSSRRVLEAVALPNGWPARTQDDFARALEQAELATNVPLRRLEAGSPAASLTEMQNAFVAHTGMSGDALVPTVSYVSGKVRMAYPGRLGNTYYVQLNAANGQYYYTLTEQIHGAAPVYLKIVPKTGGGSRGLTACGSDMLGCHYRATGF